MTIKIKHADTALILAAALSISTANAQTNATGTQAYPAKPVRVLVGFAPGGGTDIVARVVAQKMPAIFGQQMLVENRAGASSNIATELVAKSAPDGYTLLMGTIVAFGTAPSLFSKLPFDPVKDFAPITQTVSVNNLIVVHPVLPAKTLKMLVALAKQRPGEINYATSGVGSSGHLAAELFKKTAGINITHIAYKGGGQAIIDVIAGHVPLYFAGISTTVPHLKAGKLIAIAVTTGKRSSLLPDVPTVAELGYPGYEAVNWYGLMAPAGTPRPIIDRLHRDVTGILKSPDTTKLLTEQGMDPTTSTPEAFGEYIKSEIAKWARVIQDIGLKAN